MTGAKRAPPPSCRGSSACCFHPRHFLYGMETTDRRAYAVIAVSVGLVSVAAAYVPGETGHFSRSGCRVESD